jgi:hypothetical protein
VVKRIAAIELALLIIVEQSGNSGNNWWMGIVEPGIQRMRMKITQVLFAEFDQSLSQR